EFGGETGAEQLLRKVDRHWEHRTRRSRRRNAADATVLPLTEQAVPIGGLPLEAVVRWLVCGDGATHGERRLRCSPYHSEEFVESPRPEASRASARRRHVLPVEIPPRILEEEADQHVQKPHCWILCRRIRNASFGQTISRFDTESTAVVFPGLAWRLDERRVDGVAVTRHTFLVVLPFLVGTVDIDREIDGPRVTVDFTLEV